MKKFVKFFDGSFLVLVTMGIFAQNVPEYPVKSAIIDNPGLPFYEPWNQGTFVFNEWTLVPANTNWP